MLKFTIKSMNCMSCVHNIEDALKEQDPKAQLRPDIKQKQIFVETVLSASSAKRVIEDAGYPVDEIDGME